MKSVLDVNADSCEREVLQSKTLVVVDFWHENCQWCKKPDPIYSELSEECKDKLKFAKLNVLESHENQHIAIGYGITGTPTLVFFTSIKDLTDIRASSFFAEILYEC